MATGTRDVRAAALKLVSRAEQCVSLLTLKLKQRGFTKVEIEPLVEELTESGILDDSRFAGAWLSSKLACGAGTPRKLLTGLLAKGIDAGTAQKSLREILTPETESALLFRYMETTGKRAAGGMTRAGLRACGFSSDALEAAGL